jgi:hypothetical protein
MRVYDNKGRLIFDFKAHASKHAEGGADEVSLAASQITSGRFGMARMPDGASGYVLTAQGGGADPVYAAAPGIPSGVIALWSGLIANIPSGWVLCDGNNGTPNLLARFVEGVASAGTNPGATGGALSKTTSGHYHGWPTGSGSYAPASGTYSPWTTTVTDSISDIRPPFYDVAFIMKT